MKFQKHYFYPPANNKDLQHIHRWRSEPIPITQPLQVLVFCAVVLKENPVILGVPSSVQLGEDVLINCTTSPAMPPANIMWFIDGKPERV
ncbi:Uncharacterized protein OBRU01_27307, partial [Operophtera brumata]